MSASGVTLTPSAVLHLAAYKRAVADAIPGVEKLILFGSHARGQVHDDSDYDIAVFVRDMPDRRHIRRVLSDLAYHHIMDGVFIRPIPLPPDYLAPIGSRATELADEIARDGIEIP